MRSKGSRRLLNGDKIEEQEERVKQEVKKTIDSWKCFNHSWAFDILEKTEVLLQSTMLELPQYEYFYTLECTLDDSQIMCLWEIANKYITSDAITANILKNCLQSTIDKPIKVKDVGALGYLFKQLSVHDYIVSNWQKIVEKNNMFVSRNGVPLTGKKISNLTTSKLAVVENIRIGRKGYRRGVPKYDKIIEPIEVIDNFILSL